VLLVKDGNLCSFGVSLKDFGFVKSAYSINDMNALASLHAEDFGAMLRLFFGKSESLGYIGSVK
jgi:hypothetical protein